MSEARALLRSLEPAPQTPAGTSFYSYSSTAGSILQTLWFYFKQFLLWHNAESLEETVKVGVEVGGNLDKAVELLQRAAEARDDDASFLLAEMNFVSYTSTPGRRSARLTRTQYGNWTHPRSYPEAFRRYKQLADDTGNSTAQHMVGFMYATGIGGAVEKDQGKVRGRLCVKRRVGTGLTA